MLLIAIIAELQAVIARLEKRIVQLEGQAKPANSRRMPGLKPNAKADRETRPAQRAPQAKAARLCPRPHDAHATGGACGGALSRLRNPDVRRLDPPHPERSVELPQVPAEVTEHVYVARICPGCRRRCLPPTQLDGVVMGKQRLRRQPAQPDRHAAGRGAAAHPQRPVVSRHRASVAPQRGGHRERRSIARRSGPNQRWLGLWTASAPCPVVHADETGWRQSGANGYVWTSQHPHRTLLPAAGPRQSGGG